MSAAASTRRRQYTPALLRKRTLALCDFVEPELAETLHRMANDEAIARIGVAANTDCSMPAFLVQVASYLSSKSPGDPMADVCERLHTPDGYQAFRRFCVEHADELRALLSARRIQSHHIERCGPLFPALCLAARQLGASEVAFLDIGAAGGLHLFWDRYAYDFESLGVFGCPASQVRLRWQWRGAVPRDPTRFLEPPRVVTRTGIDLAPIDLRSPDGRRWAAAFGSGPEEVLDAALAVADGHAHEMLAGDCLDLLPGQLSAVPASLTPLVMHCFTTIQFSEEMRSALEDILIAAGKRRPLARVWLDSELDSREPVEVRVATYTPQGIQRMTVARGALPVDIWDWFEWVGPTV